MWRGFSDGRWVSEQRIRAVALISGAMSLCACLYLVATAHGTLDRWGRPLGTDFAGVYAAGRMALAGDGARAWSWGPQYAVQQAVHGSSDVPFVSWHYPPPFLLLAAALAWLPYLWALFIYQGATLSAALVLVRRIVPRRQVLLLALAAPITFICLGHGQNGFLTATLLGGGLLLLDRRPILAGLLLGCLVYKPQFAPLVPPLLVVGGHWRALAAAAASAGLLVALTLMLWGWPVWAAFLHSLPLTREVVIESGIPGWGKIHSIFAMVRMWGGGIALGYSVQAVASLAAIASALWLTRRASPPLRNGAACAAALLSTPYVLDYDFVLLAVGLAFIVRDAIGRGFLSWEKSLLAFVWIAPLFSRQLATLALLPVGQASALIVLGLAVRRAVILDQAAELGLRTSPFRHLRAASAR